MKTSNPLFVLTSLALATAAPAGLHAQQIDAGGVTVYRTLNNTEPRVPLDKSKQELYSGMIPGTRDDIGHITQKTQTTRAATKLTWVGFLPEERRTRVFLQFDGTPEYSQSMNAQKNELTLSFQNAKVVDKNLLHSIDTRFYRRAVRRITVKRKRNKRVVITLTLQSDAQPQIDTQGSYLYIDFAHDPDAKKS